MLIRLPEGYAHVKTSNYDLLLSPSEPRALLTVTADKLRVGTIRKEDSNAILRFLNQYCMSSSLLCHSCAALVGILVDKIVVMDFKYHTKVNKGKNAGIPMTINGVPSIHAYISANGESEGSYLGIYGTN